MTEKDILARLLAGESRDAIVKDLNAMLVNANKAYEKKQAEKNDAVYAELEELVRNFRNFALKQFPDQKDAVLKTFPNKPGKELYVRLKKQIGLTEKVNRQDPDELLREFFLGKGW